MNGPSPRRPFTISKSDTPRPIREIIPETPDWLCAVIAKLQAKDPHHRYQTASEVADVLSGYLAHLDDPALDAAERLLGGDGRAAGP